jgi:ActR/RegA family two-component response regulator
MPAATSEDTRATRPSGDESIGSRYIRALLNRHGIPSSRHVTLIAEVLGFGYTPVYRRMNGVVAWELEEIEMVASHFGESLASVFAESPPGDSVAAVLAVGGVRIPCQLLRGDRVRQTERNTLVAIQVGLQWVVLPASEAGGGPCFEVRQMLVSGEQSGPRRIAILDDDESESASLAEYFRERGCEAEAFTRVDDLVGHMKVRSYDAYVIDWVLNEGNAAELLAMIRADDAECPIAILTGKMEADVRIEAAVAEALSTYKLLFFQKPTRLPLISSQLLRALGGQ